MGDLGKSRRCLNASLFLVGGEGYSIRMAGLGRGEGVGEREKKILLI
jgi:hypothetical protein